MVGIYKITSPSGKVYIGQSKNITARWKQHKYINDSKHHPILFKSYNKYGIENHVFKVIHELPKDVSWDVVNLYEVFYINQYKECGIGLLNAKGGGDSVFSLSKEIKQKISTANKGRPSWNKGKTGIFSNEVLAVMSQKMTGKKQSQEHIEKVRKSLFGNTRKKGKANSPEAQKRGSDKLRGRVGWNKGIKLSEGHKAKIHKFPKGNIPWNTGLKGTVKHSDETRADMSRKMSERWVEMKNNNVNITHKGEQCHKSKLKEWQVLEIKSLLQEGIYNDSQIGRFYGVTSSPIYGIKSGKTWKHLK